MIDFANLQKPAIVTKWHTYTYAEIQKLIQQYAAMSRNIESDKVAIVSENRSEWIFAFYAGWLNGKIVVPIDHTASVDDVAYMLNDSRPGVVYYSNGKKETIIEASRQLQYKPEFVCLDESVDVIQPLIRHITHPDIGFVCAICKISYCRFRI